MAIFGLPGLGVEEPIPDVVACCHGLGGVVFIDIHGQIFFVRSRPKHLNLLKKVIAVSCGAGVLIALSDEGIVYSTSSTENPNWSVVEGLRSIVQISAGKSHFLALSNTGEVYGWGCNEDGALGNNSTMNQTEVVRADLDNLESERVVFIVAGGYHSILITDRGRCFSYGYGSQGQLGLGNTNNIHRPTLISALTHMRIVGAACTFGSTTFLTGKKHTHSIEILDDGQVWVCGWASSGRLGLGEEQKNQYLPVQVPNISGADSVLCGSCHVVVRLKNGEYWGWGEHTGGQLGKAMRAKQMMSPTKLSFFGEEDKPFHHWRTGVNL